MQQKTQQLLFKHVKSDTEMVKYNLFYGDIHSF